LDTGKQSRFAKTEHESSCQQSLVIGDKTGEGHYNAPAQHDGRKPDMWLQAFEQNVGGYFEKGEADVEKSETDVKLCIRHSKIGNQLDSLSPRSGQR